jgi:molecular chaperone GrpE
MENKENLDINEQEQNATSAMEEGNDVNEVIQSEQEETLDDQLDPLTELQTQVAEAKDKYLRLYSEFENFRRRTSKEKLDMVKTASENLVSELIPVLDDFERALKALEKEENTSAKEGMELIYNKFNKTLTAKGVKVMDLKAGDDFDADTQEAITQIPVEDEKMKGKIVDVVEKGYFLGDKVVRFAKVVLGA